MQLDWLSGCSLVIRPSAHIPSARFDPAFPLYYEDMDLCLRLSATGAPVLWWPALAVTHQRGAGSHTPSERRQRLSTLSYLRFLRRHRPGWVLALRSLRLLVMTLLRLPRRRRGRRCRCRPPRRGRCHRRCHYCCRELRCTLLPGQLSPWCLGYLGGTEGGRDEEESLCLSDVSKS